MMELLLAPFLAFIFAPPLAFLPAIALLWLRRRLIVEKRKARLLLGAGALLWVVYAFYESAVWVWSQGVVAPIRIDLFLVAPLLYVASAVALASSWQRPPSQA